MSINGILQAGTSALHASQTVLRSISNNIANVNTPGYARERVNLESLSFGTQQGGVKVSGIEVITNQYLEQSARTAVGQTSYQTTLSEYHDRLQSLLGRPDGENTLAAQTDRLFSGLQQLTASPTDPVLRRDAVSRIRDLLNGASQLGQSLQTLRTDVSTQLASSLTTVNDLIKQLDDLNSRVREQKVVGDPATALIEQRNRTLDTLSQHIDIVGREQPDGSVQVSTGTGLVLLDASVRRAVYVAPSLVTASTDFAAIGIRSVSKVTGQEQDTGLFLDNNALGGKIRAYLDLRDQELPATAASLGEFVRTTADQLNRVHNDFSSVPPPNSLVGRNTGLLGGDAAHFTGRIVVGITDANSVLTRSVTVDLSTKATINDIVSDINTQLAGAGTASFTNGVFSITAASGGVVVANDPSAPSDRAGRGFAQTFGLNDLITGPRATYATTGVASIDPHGISGGSVSFTVRNGANLLLASPTINLTAGGTFGDIVTALNDPQGLGKYASFSLNTAGELIVTPRPGAQDVQISVADDTTQRGGTGISLSQFFDLGQSQIVNTALQLQVRSDISANPQYLASAKFDPVTVVGAFALSAGDARGVQSLRDSATLGLNFAAAGNLAAGKKTLSQYVASLIADVSSRAQRATQAASDSQAVSDTLSKKRDDYEGVNIDEELSSLIVYQNSYSAAARLITTARDLYDQLLSLVR